jgi:hypothetical protein
MAERTKRELAKVYQDAMLKRHKEGDPDRTYVSDCQEAGQRACYDLGASDARAALEAENAALRARVEGVLRKLEDINTVANGGMTLRDPSLALAVRELRAALTPTTVDWSRERVMPACPDCKSEEIVSIGGTHLRCLFCKYEGERRYFKPSGTGRATADGGEAG